MSNSTYSNDRSLEAECGVDLQSTGGIFHSDFKRHDDLKEMLDSNKDSLKLEAMKRIIGMIAKGRDASMLFPAVVKNVVSKNIEVKKLVYVYLERYAEEQQDLALLSISTFQRALKEPNQLIRAGALRVLSSVRVTMIAPIVMLAIRDAAADMSPYVRKTAAHAIPKLYSLDKEQKPELIMIIQKLLADRTVLVIGSAVMAFTKVCPEREDLIHMVYRKLCNLLIDVDEWGQVIIVNTLTRYAMTQFADPRDLDSSDSTANPTFYNADKSPETAKTLTLLDADHKLLLRSTRPLLQSRNAAVVMAVSQLYYYCAPKGEFCLAAKALVRLLRSHTEVQTVVLHTIASISYKRRGMFEAYLKSFFVRTSDPTRIKLLKLDILTNLATDSNVSTILRELQTYISSSDKQFVAATIQAIGRCACSITEVTDSCLNGLVCLLSNKDEAVVAESVVVIKRLLQTRAAEPSEIITHMARLLDGITVAAARAAILWLLGEHCEGVPKVAPDVLRKVAKTFSEEHDIVKLQTLNLAVKLFITNPEQTSLLCYYVFNLARYDQNYDIRDRVRFLRQFTHGNARGKIVARASEIFLAAKPAPLLQSQFKDREELQLGSLSHFINARANGYEALPTFPENPPPGDVRNVEPQEYTPRNKDNQLKRLLFPDKTSSSEESRKSSSESSSESTENSSSEAEDDEESESAESSMKAPTGKSSSEDEEDDEESSTTSTASESSSSSDSSSESEDETDASNKNTKKTHEVNENHLKPQETAETKSNLDLLLDLDISDAVAPVMTPSLGGFLTPLSNTNTITNTAIQAVPPAFYPVKEIELLDRISGRGLSITYRYTRNPHLFSPNMVNFNLSFKNTLSEEITDIRMGKKSLSAGMAVYEFACIQKLAPNSTLPASLGIDFNDTLQTAGFEIISSLGTNNVLIKPTIGELLRPVKLTENIFEQEQLKLKGMNEHTSTVDCGISEATCQCVYEIANVAVCGNAENLLRFAAQTLLSSSLVLVTLRQQENRTVIVVNCEKYVVGSMLLNELKSAIKETA